jgi:hypothetical protein
MDGLEDDGCTAVAFDDGGGKVALGGGVGGRLKIGAVPLGSGSGRMTCIDGIGIRVVEAKGLILQHWSQRW